MKFFSLLFLGIWLTGVTVVSEISPLKQTNTSISLALPELMDIEFNDGRSMSAVQLTDLDTSTQEITVEKSEQSQRLKLTVIKKITLRGEVILEDDTFLVFQGENSTEACGDAKELRENLSNFNLVQPQKAEITISDPQTRRAFSSIDADSTLIVEQITVESAQQPLQILLKVKACRQP